MAKYEELSLSLTERMRSDILNNSKPNFAKDGSDAVRRDMSSDRESIWRPAYSRDVDKILHSP